MRFTPKSRLLALALLAVACLVAPAAYAQSVTTGTLAGSVSGSADAGGGVLPGAVVTAVHGPTGARYSATTGNDGRFTIVNVRSGGPYTVSAAAQGYKDTSVSNVTAVLGTPVEVTIEMPLAAVEETINVVATADEIINPNKTGSTSAVSTETIENGATVHRQIQDFARMNPYFTVDAHGRRRQPHQRRRPQQPLQHDPDRRRGEQRPLRPRRHRHAGRSHRRAADLARRHRSSCSCWCRRTTCARAASPAAASTP